MEKRVLVVEEEGDARGELARALERAGVRAVVASDGGAALERLREDPAPSVILIGLRSPKLGGEELLRALRADPRHERLPVITMTAGTDRGGGRDLGAGPQGPSDVQDLLAIVLSLFEASAA